MSGSETGGLSRQVSEFSQAACSDLMHRQCSGFMNRQTSSDWRRTRTEVAYAGSNVNNWDTNKDVSGFGRQSSCPPLTRTKSLVKGQENQQLGPLDTIKDEASSLGDGASVCEETVIDKAVFHAVEQCSFCISIADPQSLDCELVAVSRAFEQMTGYDRSEILAENCRFLNKDCSLGGDVRAALEEACNTGAPFTSVLVNRKKSGELFLNHLDMRGLTVARNSATGEDIWLIVALQEDVTGRSLESLPCDRTALFHQFSKRLRAKLLQELAANGMSGALQIARRDSNGKTPVAGEWQVTFDLKWKPGEQLAPNLEQLPDLPAEPGRAKAAQPPITEEPSKQRPHPLRRADKTDTDMVLKAAGAQLERLQEAEVSQAQGGSSSPAGASCAAAPEPASRSAPPSAPAASPTEAARASKAPASQQEDLPRDALQTTARHSMLCLAVGAAAVMAALALTRHLRSPVRR
jgi:hypothetical protein